MSDLEHLFMLAICMSSLEKCLFRPFPHFFIGLFVFSGIELYELLYILNLILCQLLHLLMFSPILRVDFSPCLVSFAVQKLLSLISSHLLTFVFISITLGGGS